MKRYLSLLLVLPLGVFVACSSSGGGTSSDGPVPIGTVQPNEPGGPAASGDSGATPNELARNPIEGIAAAKLTLDTGEATDGAIWSVKEGVLFFTTPLGQGGLYRMLPDGTTSKIRAGNPATGAVPIGNTIDKAGNLLTIEAKRIMRGGAAADAGAPAPFATGYPDVDAGVAPFDTLKSGVVSADGNVYATDPGYFVAPVANRIYRITPAGKVTVVEAFENVPRPNGIALTPDGKGLYVGFTQPETGIKPYLRRYVVNADGSVGGQVKFVDLDMDSMPDGIEVDQGGNVLVATKSGIVVFKSDGTKLGVVPVPEQPTGMAYGGKDLKTLYVTTLGTKIFELALNVPGIVQ
jgi:gluconolactonase